MPLELSPPNPAYATIKKLLSPAVDVLLRPEGGWKRPDDLLGALAEKIATNKGERGAWEEPRIADPEKAEVIGTLNAELKSAANAWLQTKPSPDDEDGARQFFSQWLKEAARQLRLFGNKIGDEGLRHLGDALARDAAPALKNLNLNQNPASATAQQAVQDALKQRKQ